MPTSSRSNPPSYSLMSGGADSWPSSSTAPAVAVPYRSLTTKAATLAPLTRTTAMAMPMIFSSWLTAPGVRN